MLSSRFLFLITIILLVFLAAKGQRYFVNPAALYEISTNYSKHQPLTGATALQFKPLDIYNMVVAQDGTGDFTKIQEAINSAKAFPDKRVIIRIKNGTYKEKVIIHEWNSHMSLIGEDREKTIITFDDNFDKLNLGRNNTFHTPTLLVQGNDFYATNLKVQNTSGEIGQAIALSVNGNRIMFENCSILGNQDTLYVTGERFQQYYKNCFIEGTTDFIFGQATALFENCTINSKSDSYIAAASTPAGNIYGFVFKNCRLTAREGVSKVFLGRPWRANAKTVFIDCFMEGHIAPEAWDNWSNPMAEKEAYYGEYNCTGPGFMPWKRVSWSHQLTVSEAEKYTKERILGGSWFQQDFKAPDRQKK